VLYLLEGVQWIELQRAAAAEENMLLVCRRRHHGIRAGGCSVPGLREGCTSPWAWVVEVSMSEAIWDYTLTLVSGLNTGD
jgi:hypothetical protein